MDLGSTRTDFNLGTHRFEISSLGQGKLATSFTLWGVSFDRLSYNWSQTLWFLQYIYN